MKIYYFLGHEQFQPEILVEHAILAESVGFDGICVSEHFHPWVSDVGTSGFALSTLGAIATRTKRVEIMTGVISPLFRFHPAIIAQAAATIDRLSKGRFSLGLGTGESINETPLGFTLPNYSERSERIREAIIIISRLLQAEKLDYIGKYYQTKKAKLYSPPSHPVPIYLAAGGIKSGTLAGEIADGVIVSVKQPQTALEKIVMPAQEKAKSITGKHLTIITSRWSVFSKDHQNTIEALRAWRGLRAPSRDSAIDPLTLQKEADSLSPEQIISRYEVTSTAEEMIEIYKPLITQLHADIIIIQSTATDQKKLITLLGTKVVPALKKIAGKS